MNVIFKRALICGLAPFTLGILAISPTLAGAGPTGAGSTVSRSYGGPPRTVSPNPNGAGPVRSQPRYGSCGYHWHPGCPTGTVTGTNKQTCKQNGEGCLRPK